MQLYDKTFFYSSLPFLLVVCFVCGFLFLRWSSIYWCEQMWQLLVVIRMMETPLHSFGLDSAVQVSFRVVAHVFVRLLGNYFEYCQSLYFVLYWHRGVSQYFILVPWIFVRSDVILHDFASYIVLCDISFN